MIKMKKILNEGPKYPDTSQRSQGVDFDICIKQCEYAARHYKEMAQKLKKIKKISEKRPIGVRELGEIKSKFDTKDFGLDTIRRTLDRMISDAFKRRTI